VITSAAGCMTRSPRWLKADALKTSKHYQDSVSFC
jgi:hypothetical protein